MLLCLGLRPVLSGCVPHAAVVLQVYEWWHGWYSYHQLEDHKCTGIGAALVMSHVQLLHAL